MFKRIFNFIKKIILSILLIYAFNKMAISLNMFIPINAYTVFLVLLGGVPSIVMLALFPVIFM